MKKNVKFIGVAAAALLAVAPVVASPVTASAAITPSVTNNTTGTTSTTTTTTNAPTDRAYFTYNNQVIDAASSTNATANVVPTTVSIAAKDTVASITKKLNSLGLVFYSSNTASGEKLNLKDSDVVTLLKNAGVTLSDKDTVVATVPTSDFNITLTGTGSSSQTAVVKIPVVVSSSTSTSSTADAPAFNWTLNGTKQTSSLNGQVFQVTVGSTFNPTNFTNSNGEQIVVSATQTATNTTVAGITVTSNPVNTSEAGRYYTVTLTANGLTGKTTTATYTVLVTSSQKQTLYANGATSIATYSIYGNNVLNSSTTFKDGDQVYVANQTRTIGGVSYSQVSTKSKSAASSSNIWVKTSSLTKPATTETSETHRVMIDSRAYDKNGNYTGKMYYYNTNINIVPTVVTINGKTYYKVAGQNEYVRVTNITGTKRVLRHNAYVYRTSYKRTPGVRKYYKGETVTTYGAAFTFKSGKKFYRITGCSPSNKMYIKKANF